MNKQSYYRSCFKKINPMWDNAIKIFIDLVDSNTSSDTRLLDIGCGPAVFLKDVYQKTEHVFRIDPDKEMLFRNTTIKHKVIGNAEKMPFDDNYFDLVVSAWVFEHLENPDIVLDEIFRVLKPDGKVIFLTPNSLNYVVWINRLIPQIFHEYLAKKLYDRREDGTYPVRYKINTTKKIEEYMSKTSFKKSQLMLVGDPSYISFNNLLFKEACFIEKMLELKSFRKSKVHIVGEYIKSPIRLQRRVSGNCNTL